MPLGRSYLSQARQSDEAIIAAAFTRHGAHPTAYVLAFADDPHKAAMDFSLTPSELGFEGPVAVFDPASQSLAIVSTRETISGKLAGAEAYAYRIVAPISTSGIAVLGDLGKFVPMGRKRVTSYQDVPHGVKLTLVLPAKETEVTIAGYARSDVVAQADNATVISTQRDATTGLFRVKLHRNADSTAEVTLHVRAKED